MKPLGHDPTFEFRADLGRTGKGFYCISL